MKKIRILILLIGIAGCSTSKITTSWKAPNTVSHQYNKLLILAVIKDTDSNLQEKMENYFVGDLKEL